MEKYAIYHQRINLGSSDAMHFKLSHPITYSVEGENIKTYDVIISSITILGKPKCQMFPSDVDGNIVSWQHHESSLDDTLDHEEVLINAGYEVK